MRKIQAFIIIGFVLGLSLLFPLWMPVSVSNASSTWDSSLGWDFQCHTHTHPKLDEMTPNEIRWEMEQVNAAFQAHGYAPPQHHAYPYGRMTSTVAEVIAEYRLSGRRVIGVSEEYPVQDWYRLKAAGVNVYETTTWEQIEGWVEECIRNKRLLNIFTHDVSETPIYGTTPTMLAQILDYLLEKQNAGLLSVVTMAEAYDYWINAPQGRAMVVISFDDGWVTDYTVAYPMFQERGLKGTSYLTTGAMGQDGRLTWDMIDEMRTTEPPVAEIQSPNYGVEGEPVFLNGSSSYDADGSIVSYIWDFGDGSTGTEVNPTHIYAQEGVYNLSLLVSDTDGLTDVTVSTVTINDTEPIVGFFSSALVGYAPLTIRFTDDTLSYDGITAWSWDFGDGGESSEQHPVYTYEERGIYSVSLTVLEGDGDRSMITKSDLIVSTHVPAPLITNLRNGSIIRSPDVPVTWVVPDSATSKIARFDVRINQDQWIDVGFATTYTFPNVTDGNHVLYVKTVDHAENTQISWVTMIVDTTTPTIAVISPPSDTVTSHDVSVSWIGSDAASGLSHYELSLDGGPWQNVGMKTTYTLLDVVDGSHNIEIKAVDNANFYTIQNVAFHITTSDVSDWINGTMIITSTLVTLVLAIVIGRFGAQRASVWKDVP
jgi:PKD repeat protein/peptidoglycan/xylan/chitin deacetylase (PgdA/CDA1 family)